MIDNPFAVLERRLNRLEFLLVEIKENTLSQTTQPGKDELLTVQEAAILLNLAVPTVYNQVSQGILPHSKKGKKLYFSKKELTDWIKSGRKKTLEEIADDAVNSVVQNKKG